MVFMLVGCGSKNTGKADFHTELQERLSTMKSYQAKGVMTFHTGKQPIGYDVEVAYKKPNYYRVAMHNEAEKVDQVIVKNKQGVFIITPSLHQSFRFQTNWPKNQGQVYLYQSIVQFVEDQLDAGVAPVLKNKKTYLIEGKANYPNESLNKQKVWLIQKTLAPKKVELYDNQEKLRVSMTFNTFQFNAAFDKDFFSKKRSLEVYEIDRQIR